MTIEERLAEAERRLAEIERRLGVTPFGVTEFIATCSQCGMNFAGTYGYACPHSSCPMGLGSPTVTTGEAT